MDTKCYEARGLLELDFELSRGGVTIRIPFTGGSMGSNGVISARYSTSSRVIQHLIESSPAFNHKIFPL